MSKEGQILALSGAEAFALHLRTLSRDEFYAAWYRLEERVKGDAAAREWFGKLESMLGAIEVDTIHFLHARLCRMLPRLADLVSFACHPEYMETPEFLREDGRPELWREPLSAAARLQKEVSELMRQRAVARGPAADES